MAVITGGPGPNPIDGTENDDLLYGLGGNDTLRGFGGDDKLDGGIGDDELFGGNGIDLLLGGDGRDSLNGGLGDDRLLGGSGRDTIFGGAGNDVINGGLGNDRMSGDAGADVFIFTFEGGDSGRDTILDFTDDLDTIFISKQYFSSINQVINNSSSSGSDSAIDLSKNGDDSPRIILLGFDNHFNLRNDIVLFDE